MKPKEGFSLLQSRYKSLLEMSEQEKSHVDMEVGKYAGTMRTENYVKRLENHGHTKKTYTKILPNLERKKFVPNL
jgi:hypothetical protein